LSWKYRASKDRIGALALEASEITGWRCTKERITLSVVVVEPDRRPRDLNWSKNLKDGITASGAIWDDDRQVRDERWVFVENQPTRSLPTAGAIVTITQG
jgi:Holliday junction resolvase RusA-like endonuclease